MNASQITAAITGQDTDDLDHLITALRNADDDQIRDLLDKVRDAVRKDTVTDVLADLKDQGETGAYGLIKANY